MMKSTRTTAAGVTAAVSAVLAIVAQKFDLAPELVQPIAGLISALAIMYLGVQARDDRVTSEGGIRSVK